MRQQITVFFCLQSFGSWIFSTNLLSTFLERKLLSHTLGSSKIFWFNWNQFLFPIPIKLNSKLILDHWQCLKCLCIYFIHTQSLCIIFSQVNVSGPHFYRMFRLVYFSMKNICFISIKFEIMQKMLFLRCQIFYVA